MAPAPPRWLLLPLLSVWVFAAAGCDTPPTYPKAHLADTLQSLLAGEQLHTTVRFIDHTIAVQLDHPGTLEQSDDQIGLGPNFEEAIRKVIINVHRVILSTDAEVRFYVLLLSDPQIPGAYLTIVRYLDDVRRANVYMIDEPEMLARTVFELNLGSARPLTIEQYVPRDIRLEEFLSWQLSRRIQQKLTEELQGNGAAQVGRCGGAFQNGEFAFTLNIAPTQQRPLDEETVRRAFQTSTALIAKVLSSYHFKSFEKIRLIHPLTGRNLVLPKGHLDIFR